jgi:hypothetical protein
LFCVERTRGALWEQTLVRFLLDSEQVFVVQLEQAF